uniref:Uncharacterized protein n=1 Tax=viral metagenome TaxID=1070528 RepID=A0A6C0HT87_9ZZZZ
MNLLDVIQIILHSSENNCIFISFQNILNNHYIAVFNIIYSFKGLTLKEAKKFKGFEIKEMPQDLEKIKFSEKYKNLVVLFYEMLMKNPESHDEFVKLLDTLPHNKACAIFILKLKLGMKKMKGGTTKPSYAYMFDNENTMIYTRDNYGPATQNLLRLFNTLYTVGLDTLILTASSILKSKLSIDVPNKNTYTKEAVEFYSGGEKRSRSDFDIEPLVPKKHKTGDEEVDEIQREPETSPQMAQDWQPNELQKNNLEVSKKLSEGAVEYITKILNSEGVKSLKTLLSADNLSDYINSIGTAATLNTLIPMAYFEAFSLVLKIALSSASSFNLINASRQNTEDTKLLLEFQKEEIKVNDLQLKTVRVLCEMAKKKSSKLIQNIIATLQIDILAKSLKDCMTSTSSDSEKSIESSSNVTELIDQLSLISEKSTAIDPNEEIIFNLVSIYKNCEELKQILKTKDNVNEVKLKVDAKNIELNALIAKSKSLSPQIEGHIEA